MGFRLIIGLFLLLYLNNYAQFLNSINFPIYACKNSNIQISFNGSFSDDDYDSVYLYLIIDDDIQLLKSQITTGENYISLPTSSEKNSYGNVNKITIDKSIVHKLKNAPFQLLLTLKGSDDPLVSVKYVWGAIQGKKRVLFNSSFLESKNNNIPTIINIAFYDKGNKAGNLLSVKKNGYFKVPIGLSEDNILVEFWAKNNSIGSKFGLIDYSGNYEIFNVALAKFYFLQINKHNDELFYDDYFIDKYQWNYYCITLNKTENKIKIYINEKHYYSFEMQENFGHGEFYFWFDNTDGNGIIEIDKFRIYSLKDKIEDIFKEKFFNTYSFENSKLLSSFDFDESSINKLIGRNNLKTYNCDLYLSSAPIFTDLPELGVEVYSGFYTIKWENNNKNCKMFVLERSENGSNFYEIYRVEPSGEDEEKFIYTDSKTTEGKVLFYRLKQIDKLGKFIYSSTIKVGVSAKEILELKPNFPNPFNPTTEITVFMLEEAEVEIMIYDITGKEIEILYRGQLNKGTHIFKFNGSEYPSGIYLCKVSSGQVLKVQKMILTK